MSLDRSTIIEFITSRDCRRRTISIYLDSEEMAKSYHDLMNCAHYNRYNKGLIEF